MKLNYFCAKLDTMRLFTTTIFSLFLFLSLPAQNFKHALDSLLGDKLFDDSDVSVAVYDLDDDSLVYAHRAQKMCRPASVLKLLTAGVALERLGVNYSICTTLGISESATSRNLSLRGEMDPLFSEHDLDVMVA